MFFVFVFFFWGGVRFWVWLWKALTISNGFLECGLWLWLYERFADTEAEKNMHIFPAKDSQEARVQGWGAQVGLEM